MERSIDEIVPEEPGTVAGTLAAFKVLAEGTEIPSGVAGNRRVSLPSLVDVFGARKTPGEWDFQIGRYAKLTSDRS
jgi:hypothetical protein